MNNFASKLQMFTRISMLLYAEDVYTNLVQPLRAKFQAKWLSFFHGLPVFDKPTALIQRNQ